MIIDLEAPLQIDLFYRALLSGKLLRSCHTPASKLLGAALREAVERALGPEPELAHLRLDADTFYTQVASLQFLEKDDKVLTLFKQSLAEQIGDTSHIYRDRLRVRVVPPQGSYDRGANGRTVLHRDTWATCLYAQINWWMPLYELQHNGIGFYPAHWSQALANDSAHWSLSSFLEDKRQTPHGYRGKRYSVPTALESPQPPWVVPQLEPNQWLVFSSAQLHTSAVNTTSRCRISFETRTMDLEYARVNAGAPNVDNTGREKMKYLLHHLHDGHSLKEAW